jgi:malonate-semialdehyde dehydrogenase (acetylating)/methylmalonate-semialdehyde dehydrogenase
MGTVVHYIDGKLTAGESTRYGDVYDPALGRVQKRVAFASKADVDRAVANAQAATAGVGAIPPVRRARVMFKFKELIERDRKALAALITSEHGKIASDAAGEVTRGLEVVEFACGIPHLLKGEFARASAPTSTAGPCASPSACARASRRSTSRPWCPCGCSPSPSRAGIHLC